MKGRRQMKPSKPVKMLRLDGKHAIHSACNNGSTAVVTREGELYLFGKDVQNAEASTGKYASILKLNPFDYQTISLN